MLQRWNSLLSSKVLVHTHVNCMCINEIEVMFGGSCINVKLNLSKVQRDSTFKFTCSPITSISFMLVNFTRVCT